MFIILSLVLFSSLDVKRTEKKTNTIFVLMLILCLHFGLVKQVH